MYCEIKWDLRNMKSLASAKSMGARLVSASAPIKKIINIGNKGIANQIVFWASTIALMFKLPVSSIINKIAELNINS